MSRRPATVDLDRPRAIAEALVEALVVAKAERGVPAPPVVARLDPVEDRQADLMVGVEPPAVRVQEHSVSRVAKNDAARPLS